MIPTRMRMLSSVIALLFATQGLALADDPRDAPHDAHAMMRAAMLAQIDAHPAPITLPAARPTPIRFVGSHEATGIANSSAHAAANAQLGNANGGTGNANGVAHQAAAAAASAAGQAQAQEAKTRTKNHPHAPH